MGQSREFPVGYPFSIIPPVAGRVVLYDGRTLHTTKPVAPWAEQMRYAVVFRISLKD
jgi:predicted 2-oxoglutarate/Fe(II)-dependent dioxygenase YbiX